MSKLRVGVFMGGKSCEREVSFNSGRTICDHLDTDRFTIIPLFQKKNGDVFILPWHFLHRGKISDFEHRLDTEAQKITWDTLKLLVDFIYIAVHGRFAEDGSLQGMLEILKIPYLGSGVFASALSMDKIRQKSFLRAAQIRVPRDITFTPADITRLYHALTLDELKKSFEKAALEFPCIVKPYKEGSSLGVSVVRSFTELKEALYKAASVHEGTLQSVLIEEKIEGMEFSCIVITDNTTGDFIPLPPTEIAIEASTHFYDYEQKYMPGRAHKFTPPRCAPHIIEKIQDTVVKTMHTLNFTTIGRIDGFVDKDENIIIIDPNTLSGMGPTSFLFREAAEVQLSHSQLINHLIDTELKAYGMEHSVEHRESFKQISSEKKIRVAVLMGGPSNEREISLESGRNVVYKLSPHSYTATPLFVDLEMNLYELTQSQLVRNSTQEIFSILAPEQKIEWSTLPQRFDFVFIGLHGAPGEDGTVQGALEMLGMPYNGSGVLTSALCMDKYKTNLILQEQGFNVPKGLLIEKEEWKNNRPECLKRIFSLGNFPFIIKPHDDGCSVMVQKARSTEQLETAIDRVFIEKTCTMVEECIVGMELTVGVIGNDTPQALPPSQAVVSADILSIEEKFLPGAGENQTPAPLPAHTLAWIQETVACAYKALDCKGYARIDCFYQPAHLSPSLQERLVFLEVNSLPGLTPATCIFHQAAEIGLRPMEFIDRIVKLGLELHRPVQQAISAEALESASPQA